MSSAAPSPAPFPSPVPAPFPGPAPAPYPQHSQSSAPAPAPIARAPYPAPAPAPIAVSPSSYEEESETECSSHHLNEDDNGLNRTPMPAPMPAPAPVSNPIPSPAIEPQPTISMNDMSQQKQPTPQDQHLPYDSSKDLMNGDKQPAPPANPNLTAAAELINTLDNAYAEANAATAATALDAEQARTAARTAAEIVRRYTTRSHPRDRSNNNNYFDQESPVAAQLRAATGSGASGHISAGRAPMMTIQTNTSFFASSTSVEPHREETTTATTTHITTAHNGGQNNGKKIDPRYFPKTPPSAAHRIAASHAEDALALSIELERTKQALEGERMAHDETKNILAEERSKKMQLSQKLQRLENTMETQRESLGRSEDALEEELKRTRYRMEAAEEDAQLALDFAKESQESREKLEDLLDEAMAEIQSLREQVANIAYYTVENHNHSNNGYHPAGEQTAMDHHQQQPTPPPPQEQPEQEQSSQEQPPTSPTHVMEPPMDQNEQQEVVQETPKRSVHFSDPISFSKSPSDDSYESEPVQMEPVHVEEFNDEPPPQVETPITVSTPNRPSRPLVSAGRKLLHQSMGKDNSFDDKTYSFEFTPEKSAERRQRLRDQLKQLDSSVVIPTPTSVDRSPQRKQLHFTTNFYELCKTAAEIIQSSGHRLELDGHWWREAASDGAEEPPLDSLARQYCQSVEVKISRQKNEISELESLCSFLEESVANSSSDEKAQDPYGANSGDGKWSTNWT